MGVRYDFEQAGKLGERSIFNAAQVWCICGWRGRGKDLDKNADGLYPCPHCRRVNGLAIMRPAPLNPTEEPYGAA